MVSTAALVLVFLQLHASNTQREDQDEARGNQQLTSSLQPPDPLHRLVSGKKPVRTISHEDEDLLDLMVRIAETPAEWERIHRVLTQIGKEKAALDERVKPKIFTEPKPNGATNNTYLPSTAKSNIEEFTLETFTTRALNTESSITLSSIPPLTSNTNSYTETDYQNDSSADDSETEADTGWPDFDEAIVKKIKRHHNAKENNIIETDWFDDEWLDTAWIDPQTNKKEQNMLDNEANINYQTVSFKPVRINEVEKSIGATNVRSRLYSDPKILEFPLEQTRKLEVQKFDDETNSSINPNKTRPVFQYHRVTTSPQERKGNSAFIAVSVVKQSASESSTVTPSTILETPWIYERNMYRPQDHDKQLTSNRKHPHWSKGGHHHHNRGHRHYHAHTRPHTHP